MDNDFSTFDLSRWLRYLEQLHPTQIDLGLTRIGQVKDKLGLQPSCPVVTITGTNGKGSTATMLATILRKAGYQVGLYTSPHLFSFNERICINLQPVNDALLIQAFQAINLAREAISLSYFEFTTLAAMQIFIAEKMDIIVLEVGLGGRLDATNIFNANIAAISSIGIDHQYYLGDTRESIGLEKAGIFRTDKIALCADPDPPQSLLNYASHIGAKLELYPTHFKYELFEQQWLFQHGLKRKYTLPFPALRGKIQLRNASLALAILDHLQDKLPVALADIKAGLLDVALPGRFQIIPGFPTVVLDVAHNVSAVEALKQNLDHMGFYPNTYAVFGMMRDKDIAAVIELIKNRIDQWFVAAPNIDRAANIDCLADIFTQTDMQNYQTYPNVASAYQAAYAHASKKDRIIIFGSFYTVAEGYTACLEKGSQ